MATPIVLSWSGGKDSAMALAALRDDPRWDVQGLLTTINAAHGRVAMQGFRESLLHEQAAALDLPVRVVELPDRCSNEQYEARMGLACARLRDDGIDHVAFGDLYLADIREYREKQMAEANMTPVFPIWLEPTDQLAERFMASGYHAVLTCVDGEQLDGGFVGRSFDAGLLANLPDSCDPCGENGEFHTFVHDGPAFARPVRFALGERVLRDERFHFIDLVPEKPAA